MDDFAFWDRVLTEEEIETIYNDGEGRTVEDAAKLLNVKEEQTGFAFAEGDATLPYSPDFSFVNTAAGGQSSGEISYAITSGTGEASIDPASGEITDVTKAGTIQVTATKTGSDLYNDAVATYTLTVEKAPPEILTAPTASQVEAGASLSDALLTGGQASVPGSFVWSDPMR